MNRLHRIKILACFFCLLIGFSVQRPISAQTVTPIVPLEFTPLYLELDSKLTDFETSIDNAWNRQTQPIIFSSELGNANSNQGEKLLELNTLEGIKLILDRLKLLNVSGVKIAINYPILMPTFSRNEEYLEFYRLVAQEVRNRNMKLFVTQGSIFRDFSTLDVSGYYNSFEQYRDGQTYMAHLIINELQPDYATISIEPTTQALETNTGLSELATPEKQVEIIQSILQNFDPGLTNVGAGIGTWENISFVQDHYINISGIDYIDIHIYPINNTYLNKAIQIIDLAESKNKKVTMSEAWLYKASTSEITLGATNKGIFGRDPYSFWSPLDQKFFRVISKLAQHKRIEFVSFFWMVYLFDYIDYTGTTRLLTDDQRFILSQQASVENILANQFSATGYNYKNIISTDLLVVDVNNDGEANNKDLKVLIEEWAGGLRKTDINNDGEINSIDFTNMVYNSQ